MRAVLLAMVACILAAGCGPRKEPVHQAAQAPGRIVSLAPSVTEMLFAVGAGPRVVAVDDYSDYPPEVTTLTRIGGLSVNYERILALKPDLVIGVSDLQGPPLDRLDKLGIRTLRLDTTTYEKTMNAIQVVGSATGCEDGGVRVAAAMRGALLAARSGEKPRYRRVLVVVEASPKLFVAGKETFFDGLMTAIGVSNAASVKGFQMLSTEGLIAMHPDLVVTTTTSDTGVLRSLLTRARLKAPVVTAPRDSFVRPGPRLADGLTWFAMAVRRPVNVP